MAFLAAAAATAASLGAGLGLLNNNGDLADQLGTRAGALASDARQVVSNFASTAGTAAINQVCGEKPDADAARKQQEALAEAFAAARGDGRMQGALGAAAAATSLAAFRHFGDAENRAAALATMQATGNSIKGACGAGMAMCRAANAAFEMHVADPSVPEFQPLQAVEDGQREQALLAQLEAAQQELADLRSARAAGDLLPLGEARKDILEQIQQDGAQLLSQPAVPAKPKLKKLRVAALRVMCTQLGLSTDGLKPELVKRLHANR